MNQKRKNSFYLIIIFISGCLAVLPLLTVSYILTWFFFLAVYMTLALSYDIVGGDLGYINLGHSVSFGLSAYAAAIMLNHNFSPLPAFVLAVLLTTAFSAIVSYPLFRLRGAYFALASFGLINLAEMLATNLRGLTGGSGGISTPSGNHILEAYYVSIAMAIGTIIFKRCLAQSRFGLALISIREDEEGAGSFGIPAYLYKCLALIISSVPAGLSGCIYVWNITYISPSSVFGLEIALGPVIMAMLGGTGTVAGPVIGTIFITLTQELFWTRVPYFHLTMYGAVLVLLGLFMPGGLVRVRFLKQLIIRFGFGKT